MFLDKQDDIKISWRTSLEAGFAAEGYSPESIAAGVGYSQATPWDQVAGDLQAAIDALAPPVFVVGYCWGGAAA